GAAVTGDAAGGEGDGPEPDALGARGNLGKRQVVGRAGHQGGGAQGGACRGGQRRAVPADHRDPVGHRRQSPGVRAGRGRPPGRRPGLVRVPGGVPGPGGRWCRSPGPRSVPVGERGVAAGVGELLGGAVEVLGEQAPDDEVGAHVGPAAVLGAQVGYAGVAQDALADAADLLGDLLGGGVVGGGAQLDALEPLVADEPPGGGQGGLGGVALAAGPGGDDVGEFGGADVPVGPGEADDADQALGEELGDGEVQAPAGGAFGGGGLGDPGAGGLFGERLGHVGPGGDLL